MIEKRFEENDANELENTLRRLIREYGFTEKKFYEIVDEVYQETDNAGFIVGRGNSTEYPNHARKEGFSNEAKTAN